MDQIWYKNQLKPYAKGWNWKKSIKKDLKQKKSNQNNEDYNWNKNKMGGQLLILVGPMLFEEMKEKRSEEKKPSSCRTTTNHHT
jgi:hypothetical protein